MEDKVTKRLGTQWTRSICLVGCHIRRLFVEDIGLGTLNLGDPEATDPVVADGAVELNRLPPQARSLSKPE